MKNIQTFQSTTGKYRQVRSGFSWPACLFGPLWALVKRAWFLFFYMAAVSAVLVIFDEALVKRSQDLFLNTLMLGLYIAYMAICGWYGNRWLSSALMKKGYRPIGEKDV